MSLWLLWWPPTGSSMFMVVVMLHIYSVLHCLYSVGNKITTTTTAPSDHFAYFSAFEVCKAYRPNPKFVRINVSNDATLESFVTEVSTAGIYEKLDTNLLSVKITQNYNMIEKTILEAKEKHLPSKIVRFNKYRHKISPWITNGILASIRHRDKLYYEKSQIPTTDANYHIL